jgi:hypothetical protein
MNSARNAGLDLTSWTSSSGGTGASVIRVAAQQEAQTHTASQLP